VKREGRRTKREARDRRLLSKLAAFVKALRWWPSAQELAATLESDRVTVWRALARLRHDRLVRMERRGAWELTQDGWEALNRSPVRALIACKPRRREHRIAAVRRAIVQRRLDIHLALTTAKRAFEKEEGTPIYE
jgi:DNA-binding transcriptional regulator YhcF (GntR family)